MVSPSPVPPRRPAPAGGTADHALIGSRSILVAHSRRHHLHQTARAYHEIDRLGAFVTQVYVHRPGRLNPLMLIRINKFLRMVKKLASYHDPVISDRVWIRPRSRVEALAWKLLGAHTLVHAKGHFGEAVGRLCSERGWGCHMACCHAMEAFGICRDAHLPCVLEQYTGHRAIASEMIKDEHERWGLTLNDAGLRDLGFSTMHLERNAAELELADVVVAGSDFVARTLVERGIDAARIHVASYGVDTAMFPAHFNARPDDEPLQIALVGGKAILKGLLYLLEAVKKLGPKVAHVHGFGHLELPESLLAPYRSFYTAHGHVTRDVLVSNLHRCHMSALPSLWEGFGMAVYECMSTGLPIVTSEHVPACVEHGVDGFVVPIRDSDAIAEAILELRDEEKRQTMARAAVDSAGRHGWDLYRHALVEALERADRNLMERGAGEG